VHLYNTHRSESKNSKLAQKPLPILSVLKSNALNSKAELSRLMRPLSRLFRNCQCDSVALVGPAAMRLTSPLLLALVNLNRHADPPGIGYNSA
jgi:hypothetical protein